jgi:hypothetical protein
VDPGDATSTFIVRMWPDPVATEQPAWRGSVEDVIRKRVLYFTNLGTMCEFMVDQRRMRVPMQDEAPKP